MDEVQVEASDVINNLLDYIKQLILQNAMLQAQLTKAAQSEKPTLPDAP